MQTNKSRGEIFLPNIVLFLFSLVVRSGEGDKTPQLKESVIQLWNSIILFKKHQVFQVMQLCLNYGAPSNQLIEFYVVPFCIQAGIIFKSATLSNLGVVVSACIVPYMVVLELIYLISHPLLNIVVNM